MGDKVKYCSWCGEECKEKPVQVADTPILEHMEEKIDAIGRTQVWGENSKARWQDINLQNNRRRGDNRIKNSKLSTT